jgi:hypothetical protein
MLCTDCAVARAFHSVLNFHAVVNQGVRNVGMPLHCVHCSMVPSMLSLCLCTTKPSLCAGLPQRPRECRRDDVADQCSPTRSSATWLLHPPVTSSLLLHCTSHRCPGAGALDRGHVLGHRSHTAGQPATGRNLLHSLERGPVALLNNARS